MRPSAVLVTGFGPFLDAAHNPSGELALRLTGGPPEGLDVLGRILPVSFTHAPPALAEALGDVGARGPRALLGLGLHRGEGFRLERRARARLGSQKPDAEGAYAHDQQPLGERDLETTLDLEALRAALAEVTDAEVRVSDDAGGYLCERVYYDLLAAGEGLGIPALFLHVPSAERVEMKEQERVVGALLSLLTR